MTQQHLDQMPIVLEGNLTLPVVAIIISRSNACSIHAVVPFPRVHVEIFLRGVAYS